MIQSKVLNPEPGIFATVLMDGEINNITILSISTIKNFFSNQFKSSKWAPLFVLNLKNWYLTRQSLSLDVLSYLHFFCLLKQEGAIKKTETFSLKDPFAWEFFACPHFKSDIHKHNRRSHVKLHNILFFLFFKKKK